MNKVILTGRLTKDPELKYLQSGSAVVNGNLAVNRKTKDEDKADFPVIVAYGKTAEIMAQYLHKGSLIGIVGQIRTRSYEQENRTVYVTEVVVDEFDFLESKKADAGQHRDFADMTPIEDDDIPF